MQVIIMMMNQLPVKVKMKTPDFLSMKFLTNKSMHFSDCVKIKIRKSYMKYSTNVSISNQLVVLHILAQLCILIPPVFM